jgi:hypothetical protein
MAHDRLVDGVVTGDHEVSTDGLPVSKRGGIDVRLRALCKTKQEYCAPACAKCDDRSIAATSTLASASNPLFNQPAANIGIDKSSLCSLNRFQQYTITDPLFTLEALERFSD